MSKVFQPELQYLGAPARPRRPQEHPAWPGVVEELRKTVRRLQGEKLQVESRLAIVMGERDKAVEQLKNVCEKIEGIRLWTRQLLSCW